MDGKNINVRIEPRKSEIRGRSIKEVKNIERILKENLDLEEITL